MKKIITMAFCLFCTAGASFAADAADAAAPAAAPESVAAPSLRDIVDGKYGAEYIYGVNPLNDGVGYSQLSLPMAGKSSSPASARVSRRALFSMSQMCAAMSSWNALTVIS